MKIKCKKCGDIIKGDGKGSYIVCKCKSIAIDETEHYVRINGNFEDYEILESATAKETLKSEELKLYDLVSWCNHEWYVIKIENEAVTLMSKDVIGTCDYSSENSNDFARSNCIKILNDFLNKLNLDNLILMKTNYDEDKFTNTLIRIPTLREIEKMPINIRKCGESYWTMTASYGASEDCDDAYVFAVNSSGNFGYVRVSSTGGVRPVIKIEKEKE